MCEKENERELSYIPNTLSQTFLRIPKLIKNIGSFFISYKKKKNHDKN